MCNYYPDLPITILLFSIPAIVTDDDEGADLTATSGVDEADGEGGDVIPTICLGSLFIPPITAHTELLNASVAAVVGWRLQVSLRILRPNAWRMWV